jgi:hypothetical protein
MGIRLDKERATVVLEDAIAKARSSEILPAIWLRRVENLGGLETKTYIAALGGALLAKATDDRVDSLVQDLKAGPHGYSLRMVSELLAERNHGRFHMGATGKNPLNNRPFLGGPARIDEFTKINPKSRPSFELFRDALTDLNRMNSIAAFDALAAWLRVRMAVQAGEIAEVSSQLALTTSLDPADLFTITEMFVREDPEGGKRGQSLVAAVLDCAFDEVVLQPINHPRPGDVRVLRKGEIVWIVEVKQVAVEEQTAVDLAREAHGLHASLAMLVVMADDQVPIDRERIRRRALQDFRVMLEVVESAAELLSTVCVFSTTTIEQMVERLPGNYAKRMLEHGVSEGGRHRWSELVRARDRSDG